VSGNRNVTLAWAAAGAGLLNHPGVELYLAMSVLPIFMLPAPSRWLVRRMMAHSPASQPTLETAAGHMPSDLNGSA